MKILHLKVFLLGLLLNSVLSLSVWAQESEGGTPPTFNLSKDLDAKLSIPIYITPAIPLEKLQAEDEVFDKGKYPYRFGYNFDVSIDIKKEGVYQLLDDGNKLWTLRVSCPNAVSINFLYSKYHLPKGAKLFLYNEDKSFILGAYTNNNNQATGKFGTETVPGEVVTLEYLEPANAEFSGEVVIGVIVHGYRTHESSYPQAQAAGSCNVNINCPEAAGWENQKRSVARIIMNGNTLCTGTLINNARQDDKPYFLTANHCIGDLDAVSKPDASGWVFYWNYESASCSGTSGSQTQTTAGATVMANNSVSDFALMQIKAKPSASYNVFYAGWNRGTAASNGAVGIHHPAGDIKKFSKDNSTLEDENGTHWRVPSWDIGVTEGGSSGSSIFDFNKRIIGQLTGGASGCGSSAQWDVYGKMSYSWDQGGTIAQRRLKDWLDPDNTGAVTLDGKNPGTVTNNLPTVTITSPADNSGFAAPANITITANASDIDGTIVKVEFYYGPNKLGEDQTAPYSFSWNNVAVGAYTFTAKAMDNAGATGISAPVQVNVFNYRTPENPANTVAGLNYSYYEGEWTELPNFTSLTAIKTGTVSTFDITPKNRDENFGFQITGYISIPTDGYYTFYTSSDDGSQFYIGSTIVVDNNGLHGEQERQGSIGLKAGKHAIRGVYFERGGGELFTVSYSGPSITKQTIPANALFRPGVTNISPSVAFTSPDTINAYTAPANMVLAATATDSDGNIVNVEFYNGSTLLGSDATAPYSINWLNVPAGTYLITARATDTGGATASTTRSVTVKAATNIPPVVSITSPANNSSFIAPASLTINANATDADGQVSKVEFFSGSTKLGEDLSSPYSFAWSGIAAGTYLITAKATDNIGATSTSSTVTITVNNVNLLPTVSITSPANNASFTAPASVTINATAIDADGQVSKVEFFNGATKLGEDLSSPYSFAWSGVATGTYVLTAKATDNNSATSTSSTVTITVNNVNQLPTISITSPANNASFTAPASVTITATATDADGQVSKVEFFNGSTKLGEDLSSPYSFAWSGVAAGTYLLTAKATDNTNATGTSSSVTIVVNTASDLCANVAQYIENNSFVPGSKVKNAGRMYECKPWPYSGWCNGAAWAYGPGTGMYWTDAWVDAGSCSKSKELSSTETALVLQVSPNPSDNFITIEIQNLISKNVNIQLFDALGHPVITKDIITGSAIDISSIQTGIYTLKVIAEGQVLMSRVVKR